MASYTLHIQYVDRPAETRTISQPKVLIGRDAGDIALHDSQVSGRHAEILWDGATLRFTDLGSTNGSFLLQGQRVANLELTAGIALRIGNSLITVQSIDGLGSSGAGKGRTVIAAPGMVPGFPAPMKPAAARPPGPVMPAPPGPVMPAPPAPVGAPQPGNFAFAPTAQHQGPLLRPAPGGPAPGAPGGFAAAPPQPMAPPMGPPAPFPAPAPPGPGPGAFGAQPATGGFGAPAPGTDRFAVQPQSAIATPPPQAVPTPISQPVAAAPMPMGPPVLVPESAIADTPPAGEPAVAALGPAGNDLVSQVKFILLEGWKLFQPVAAPAVATVGAVLIPIGLLAQLGLMILPLSIAALLATLLSLVQLAAMVILMPSLGRFMLSHYLGQPISIQAAVQQSIAGVADVAVNCFIPGIVFGVFAAPIYYVEDKKLGAVIGRNFSLLKLELVPILATVFGAGLAVGLVMTIVGMILGFLPLGGILNSILVNGVMAFMIAFFSGLSVWLYFWVRRKHEGGDPESEARARLDAAAGALPSA
ncbi:FHA domain-containing protein [Nannocystis punicea]|uniref:FHA domain-containing protein n=1 Tax=Nannocystis punicea TaxID=2995304 RepID=A0ABY7H0F8_9BACT|nr:FHA domain-containing protein [Nannocystis poenicansa]WAS92742.1 FHA domain-containing protein [Nannocystis poenicansa]